MISYEEACCLALDLIPLPANYVKAVEEMEKTPFDVVYEDGKDPSQPVVIAKTIIAKNPFKWKRYAVSIDPDTDEGSVSSASSSNDITSKLAFNFQITFFLT